MIYHPLIIINIGKWSYNFIKFYLQPLLVLLGYVTFYWIAQTNLFNVGQGMNGIFGCADLETLNGFKYYSMLGTFLLLIEWSPVISDLALMLSWRGITNAALSSS